MAYDLKDFNTTYYGRAFQNSQSILNKWPYLCSRESLIRAVSGIATGSVTQRNPNGYTAAQMADKIIERFDEIMYDTWFDSTVYHPTSMSGAINQGYRWDQNEFWDNFNTHFIFHNGDGAGVASFIIANIDDIVIWPATSYTVNSAEFKRKPFLGFDKAMMTSQFATELDMTGSNVLGITSGGITTDDADNPIPVNDIHKSLMFVYDNRYYHPTLQPNGYDSTYWDGADPVDWTSFPSSRRYDLDIAKFEVTVSGGVVTAITGVTTLDGDGTPVNGGWNYYSSNDYQELSFTGAIEYSSATQIAPRILFRTTVDQPGYSGNKATVNISDPTTEFYEGKNLTDGTYTAWAVKGSGGKGYASTPDVTTSYDDWFNVNLPFDILPSSVRMIVERPVLKSTTRSLKEIRVGTGAHRTGWEFEYPPMTQDEADPFIAFFELAKGGARDVQIFVPKTVMPNTESVFYNVDVDVASNFLIIESGKTLGSDEMILSGLQPGYAAGFYLKGIYFNFGDKAYRITDATTVDDYGRTAIKFEPPLVSTGGSFLRGRTTNLIRGTMFAIKAKLVDDALDYTIDAAGHYRLRFKFVEAL